jgi:hypothetical protein
MSKEVIYVEAYCMFNITMHYHCILNNFFGLFAGACAVRPASPMVWSWAPVSHLKPETYENSLNL